MEIFWTKLPKPFFALAPMAEVTDAAFRRIIAKYGKLARIAEWRGGPDVMWTEFVSADGLVSRGRERLRRDLVFTEAERPIVAQLFTAKPEKMLAAAKIIVALGFDGLDINMGCPDRKIEKQGAGAALMKNPPLARELIAAAKAGVAGRLPVSVKTRLGYARDELETWLPELLAEKLAAITIHARTRAEMSRAPAHWDAIMRAVAIRDDLKSKTLIIGNGDAPNLEIAKIRAEETGADGIMLGRAIFGNPWLFVETAQEVSPQKKLQVLAEHARLFEKLLGKVKSFAVLKKHFKAYLTGFSGVSELRQKLMAAPDAATVGQIIDHEEALRFLRG